MANELAPLNSQEEIFIDALLHNGGNIKKAGEVAGYADHYCYLLRKRLTKHIIEATQDYFAVNAPKAAHRVVESIDAEMPNANNLNAALALLDRVGIIKKDLTAEQGPKIQANIFILPAKEQYTIIDHVETETS